jgi:transcriptional regulator with XRE-family HTH domain
MSMSPLAQAQASRGALAPFLTQLVERSGLLKADVARAAGVARSTLLARLAGRSPLAADKLRRIVQTCGGSEADIRRARVLDALDRRALHVPPHATEATVARAMAVLDGAS